MYVKRHFNALFGSQTVKSPIEEKKQIYLNQSAINQ